MPSSLNNHGITAEADVIKILGAFLGETARVSEKLVQKLEKHRTAFRRLKQMGASNVSLLLLSKSINVRHRYHIRVQNPDESLKLTQKFDHEVASVVRTWFGNLSDKKIKWTRLPLKKGGLGLTAYEHIREASYTASRQTALERPKHLSALAGNLACASRAEETSSQTLPNEESVSEALYHEETRSELMKDKQKAAIIRATSQKGNYTWLTSSTRLVSPRHFTLAIMPRFDIVHPRLPDQLNCPGCQMLLSSKNAITHVSGCVQCTGNNSTMKHHMQLLVTHP